MTLPQLDSGRFTTQQGVRIIVQVPDTRGQQIIDAVLAEASLQYGDHGRVSFRTASGIHQSVHWEAGGMQPRVKPSRWLAWSYRSFWKEAKPDGKGA